MKEAELKPCPFCGCEAIYNITREDEIVGDIPQLFCDGCKMIFEVENDSPYMSDRETFNYLKEKLYKVWNTRKPMQEIEDKFRKLFQHHNATKTVQRLVFDILKDIGG